MSTTRICVALLFICLGCGDDTTPVDDADVKEDITVTPDADTKTCPSRIRLETRASGTSQSVGWSGYYHGIATSDATPIYATVTACDDDCRNCRFEGPIDGPEVATKKRCTMDARKLCETDEDCTGKTDLTGQVPSTCRYLYGNPLANVVTCVINHFEPTRDGGAPVQGSVDLLTGALNFDHFAFISLSNNQAGSCAQCLDDPSPRDGMREGTCSMGQGLTQDDSPNMGEKCDAFGAGTFFPGTFSPDCGLSQSVRALFSDNPLSTNGTVWTLDETRPKCTGAGVEEEHCWCGLCEGSLQTCTSDSDCGGGKCGSVFGEGEVGRNPTRPTACLTPCNWNAETQTGSCMGANIFAPDPTMAPPIPIGCYPSEIGDTLIARGKSEPVGDGFNVTVASLVCSGPSGMLADQVLGSPGPWRAELKFNLQPLYD